MIELLLLIAVILFIFIKFSSRLSGDEFSIPKNRLNVSSLDEDAFYEKTHSYSSLSTDSDDFWFWYHRHHYDNDSDDDFWDWYYLHHHSNDDYLFDDYFSRYDDFSRWND
ncbi:MULTISPECIES: hypothetical protein [Thermodesulfobacterium]|uniref:hypothetical protein n=1 Tax=Thermodesulfobacterium TaxID=1740 RepID=UPI002357369E|nr:hypothetical protein [Thermodesulfobacterium sp.]MBZ4682387.1 hypothetical protein [Thermodesulfobacterium sp.]MDK2861539.1 hypothetical protein [Thermodesulfobacterium sp.]